MTSLRDRFFALVDVRGPEDCWPWLGSRDERGYGKINVKRADGQWVPTKAPRVALELAGVDVTDLFACHHCDNPACVNPAHLYAGTHRQNMDDMLERGRVQRHGRGGVSGERNHRAKLTAAQVVAIREGYAAGRKVRGDLDRAFGVNFRTIYNVLDGSRWASV